MEPKQIKEGYLVKKGTVLNSWKVVWVVLSEDGVEFFKRKTDNASKGMIPLKGAVLTSPCQDFSKRTFVFKLRTAKNQDHYFQASHLEERESWVKDIKRVITCLQGGRKFTRKSTRRSIRLPDTINLSELYILMRDQEDGVKELKLEKEKRVYNHCFTGGTVVDWLISKDKARNRHEALMLATGLLTEGFLQPAGDMSKEAVEGGAESAVLDDPDALYYFGHRRKNWNVRKFILRDDPAYIHYYDPTKVDESPLGSIHLRGSVITAVEFVPEAKRYDVDGNLFEIITSDDTHYFLQATTPEERKEWIKAIHTVSKTGK
ncbi:pleckstrin-like isoform X2 [Oncorhynchus clarkii lewisi]|uniref:pleckstrin-like isoform X2 n=1 Tax=Oncorhynchus clarkii lewisi TaxID=490388 RepID=UPI0039B91523